MNEKNKADSFFKTAAMHVLRLVILPLLLLAIIETAAGFFTPYSTSLFIKDKHTDGTDVYRVNYQAGYRFFPGRLARKPLPEFFAVNKPKDRLRIFVLGESAARGESLSDFSFSRMLEAALNQGAQRKAEVINTGIPAINSWVLREFAGEIVNYEPDLIIVYAGHNEFIGPFGPSGFSAFDGNRSAVLAGIWASSLNLTRLFRTDKLPDNLQQGWKGLEMFYRNKIPPGSASIARCRLNWQQNMADIFALAKSRNIPVMWCPVPVNIKDCPPFLSDDSRLSEQEKKELNELINQISESGAAARMEQLKAWQAKFPQHALLNYLQGQAFLSAGNFVEARNRLNQALENDCFIVRATTAVNDMATQVAKETGAIISDVSKAFEQASDNGLTGSNLVYDHVHLTDMGHYIAAKTIWNSIQSSDLAIKSSFTGAFPDFSVIRKLTGYTASDEAGNLQRIIQAMSNPPFSFQFDAEKKINSFKHSLELIKSQINLAGDVEMSQKALQEQPYNAAISHRIALMYGNSNRASQEYFNHSNSHNPFNIDTWNNYGLFLMTQGVSDQAEAAMRKALSLSPDFARAHFNLANLFNEQKNTQKAAYHYNEAVKSDPSMASAWRNLANIYFRDNNFSQALIIYKNAVEMVPEDLLSQIGISNCLLELNNHDEAIRHLTATCASFASPLPLFSIGLAREKMQQFNEAAAAYRLASAYDHQQSLQRIIDLHLNDKIGLNTEELTLISEKLCQLKDFKDPWLMQVYASALINQGKKQEALAILYRAEKLALDLSDSRLAIEISSNIKAIEQP